MVSDNSLPHLFLNQNKYTDMDKNENIAVYNTLTKSLYYNSERATQIENRSVESIRKNKHYIVIPCEQLGEMLFQKKLEISREYR